MSRASPPALTLISRPASMSRTFPAPRHCRRPRRHRRLGIGVFAGPGQVRQQPGFAIQLPFARLRQSLDDVFNSIRTMRRKGADGIPARGIKRHVMRALVDVPDRLPGTFPAVKRDDFRVVRIRPRRDVARLEVESAIRVGVYGAKFREILEVAQLDDMRVSRERPFREVKAFFGQSRPRQARIAREELAEIPRAGPHFGKFQRPEVVFDVRPPGQRPPAADDDLRVLRRFVDDRRLLGAGIFGRKGERLRQIVRPGMKNHRHAPGRQPAGMLHLADQIAGPLEMRQRMIRRPRGRVVAVGRDVNLSLARRRCPRRRRNGGERQHR